VLGGLSGSISVGAIRLSEGVAASGAMLIVAFRHARYFGFASQELRAWNDNEAKGNTSV